MRRYVREGRKRENAAHAKLFSELDTLQSKLQNQRLKDKYRNDESRTGVALHGMGSMVERWGGLALGAAQAGMGQYGLGSGIADRISALTPTRQGWGRIGTKIKDWGFGKFNRVSKFAGRVREAGAGTRRGGGGKTEEKEKTGGRENRRS
mgnify:CR=1 FL=1